MSTGDKENTMTVTLSKRLFEDGVGAGGSAALSPQQPASKRLRHLSSPLAEHLVAPGHLKPLSAGHHQHSAGTVRKRGRAHDSSVSDSGVGAASGTGSLTSPTSSKRGKRADGRASTAGVSPATAKSALEALLTCEGLEKDPDLEAELVYVTNAAAAAAAAGSSQQQQDGSATAAGAAAAAGSAQLGDSDAAAEASSDVPAVSTAQARTPAAAASLSRVQDAARSSREKRRDQDQGPRSSHRASTGGGGGSSSRDQADVADAPASAAAATADASAGAGDGGYAVSAESPRAISLDLLGDKEWQRLFAVLTISDASASRQADAAAAAGCTPPATAATRFGHASHRLAQSLDDAAATATATTPAAAAAVTMQEAPSTPARVEQGSANSGGAISGCIVTPTRRSSFLAGEFSRVVQQQLRSTPPRPSPPALAAAAACDADMRDL